MKKIKIFKNNKRKEEEKGITLVALVVTIVVLLILAGISINLVLSNNGIITKAGEAKEKHEQGKENDQTDLDDAEMWIDQWASGISKPIKVSVNSKASANGTIDGKKATSYNPIIPEGYTPIDTDTSSWGDGNSSPAQDDVDQGLVIKDDDGNEWVWVPVEDVTEMCDTSNSIEYTLSRTNSVKTKLFSRAIKIESSDTTLTDPYKINPYSSESGGAGPRGVPGDTNGYNEPELVEDDLTYYGQLGFSSSEEMAEAFVADYKEMIESIGKYGGFYVGRYEISDAGVQKNQTALANKTWYELYQACANLDASDKVKTRMIWGCQWDMVCNFITNKGEKKNVWDSSSWGNYRYDDHSNYGKTGLYEDCKANNMYDIAGNLCEWTQEKAGENKYARRVYRGGSINNGAFESYSYEYYSGSAASKAYWFGSNAMRWMLTSRPTLIVK